ncbi:MAG: CpaF family protein [Eubacterium sp.]|nr:CpaF family protein [Eubacterium sp.]
MEEREMKEQIQRQVMEQIPPGVSFSDEELMGVIERQIQGQARESYLRLEAKKSLRRQIYNAIRKMDVLQDLLEDEEITEIMVNGPSSIFVEKNGKIQKTDRTFESPERLDHIAQQIASGGNRIVNESNPILDVRLEDGSRVNIVVPPIALNGPVITIRKFPKEAMTMDQLLRMDAISKEAAVFLEKLVKARYNIFISGGTGAGKTTFLNILSNFIPREERIITIEDSAELQIRQVPNLVRLEARNANVEGKNQVTIRDLVKSSLRMRPDRVVVGEIRDAAAIDLLSAMNTGHDGSLSTGHANSPRDMLNRLETLVLMGMDIPLAAVRQQIASGIDILVHLGRLRDGSRRVLQIDEIVGIENGMVSLRTLFEFREKKGQKGRVEGALCATGKELQNQEKCQRAGVSLL